MTQSIFHKCLLIGTKCKKKFQQKIIDMQQDDLIQVKLNEKQAHILEFTDISSSVHLRSFYNLVTLLDECDPLDQIQQVLQNVTQLLEKNSFTNKYIFLVSIPSNNQNLNTAKNNENSCEFQITEFIAINEDFFFQRINNNQMDLIIKQLLKDLEVQQSKKLKLNIKQAIGSQTLVQPETSQKDISPSKQAIALIPQQIISQQIAKSEQASVRSEPQNTWDSSLFSETESHQESLQTEVMSLLDQYTNKSKFLDPKTISQQPAIQEKPSRLEKSEKLGRTERSRKFEKSRKSEKSGKSEKSEKVSKPDKSLSKSTTSLSAYKKNTLQLDECCLNSDQLEEQNPPESQDQNLNSKISNSNKKSSDQIPESVASTNNNNYPENANTTNKTISTSCSNPTIAINGNKSQLRTPQFSMKEQKSLCGQFNVTTYKIELGDENKENPTKQMNFSFYEDTINNNSEANFNKCKTCESNKNIPIIYTNINCKRDHDSIVQLNSGNVNPNQTTKAPSNVKEQKEKLKFQMEQKKPYQPGLLQLQIDFLGKNVKLEVYKNDTSHSLANRLLRKCKTTLRSSSQLKKLIYFINQSINQYSQSLTDLIEHMKAPIQSQEFRKFANSNPNFLNIQQEQITYQSSCCQESEETDSRYHGLDTEKSEYLESVQQRQNYSQDCIPTDLDSDEIGILHIDLGKEKIGSLKIRENDNSQQLAFQFIQENQLEESYLNVIIEEVEKIKQQWSKSCCPIREFNAAEESSTNKENMEYNENDNLSNLEIVEQNLPQNEIVSHQVDEQEQQQEEEEEVQEKFETHQLNDINVDKTPLLENVLRTLSSNGQLQIKQNNLVQATKTQFTSQMCPNKIDNNLLLNKFEFDQNQQQLALEIVSDNNKISKIIIPNLSQIEKQINKFVVVHKINHKSKEKLIQFTKQIYNQSQQVLDQEQQQVE